MYSDPIPPGINAVPKAPLSMPPPSPSPPKKSSLWATVKRMTPVYWRGFVAFARTPSGAFITFMMAMFVFWGAFLFLLLVRWAKFPTEDQQGLWVEITSQVENGFFSIMGIGFFPQRIWVAFCAVRLSLARGNEKERLRWSGFIERQYGWFNADDRPTRRAFPWQTFKLVIFLYLLHSCLQCCISGFMWGYNRFNRPNIAIAVLVPLSFLVIIAAEAVIALQGRRLRIADVEDDGEEMIMMEVATEEINE